MIIHGEIVARVVTATRADQAYRDEIAASIVGPARRALSDPDAVLVRARIGSTHACAHVVSRGRHMTVTITLATGETKTEEIAR